MKKQLLLTSLSCFSAIIASAQGRVGIGITTPQATLHVAGRQQLDTTLQFGPTSANMPPMIHLFPGGTLNKDRMVIAHSPFYTNWGLEYSDSLDKFNFLSGGTPVFTTDLGSWRVGVGTSSPETRLDILGTGSYNLATSEGDFRLGDDTYRLKMGVASSGGGAGDAYIASSHRLYLGAGTTLGRTQTLSINSNGRVGVGTGNPSARLQVVGDTGITVPAIQATTSYVGSSDVRGITSFSKPSDGWGYGVEGTGGFIGGYFSGLSGAYTGTGFGVYGTASGTAGTRIGVYGTASGGTVNNWGGYFPTKSYTSEIRVGGETGATGYAASINGKLIATEVKISPVGNWSTATTAISSTGTVLSLFSDGKTFTFNGTGGSVSSDARLKQDITPLTGSLRRVMMLAGYSYRFKTKATDPRKEIGVLAQEVQAVLPEAVSTNADGTLAVSYNALVPLLINAVKEQQTQIEKQEEEMTAMKARLDRLEKRLADEDEATPVASAEK